MVAPSNVVQHLYHAGHQPYDSELGSSVVWEQHRQQWEAVVQLCDQGRDLARANISAKLFWSAVYAGLGNNQMQQRSKHK